MTSDFSSNRDFAATEDGQLVMMVRSGRRDAFDELDRRYRDRICRYLMRHVNALGHAEELAQQTLIRAFEMINQLRQGDRLGPWLYRIAYRLMIDDVRKNRRHAPLENDLVDDVRSTVDDLIAEEEKFEIWQVARKTLSQDEFAAIELRYVENFNIAEIAKIMSRSQVSVRVLLHRARNRLLTQLSDE